MCRNIKPLFNFAPPSTDEEILAAAIQFVRKVSGFTKPSEANRVAFETAIEAISEDLRQLLNSLETNAAPKIRSIENEKKARLNALRFPR